MDPPTWRLILAAWPHARWKAWRDRTTTDLAPGATVEQIHLAEWQAFQAVLIYGV